MGKGIPVLLALVALLGGGAMFLQKYQVGVTPREEVEGGAATQETSLPVGARGDNIRIASFNIQVFGTSKLAKPHVMDILARIVREFDVVAVQEIRALDQSVLPQFVELINATGRQYDYYIGPRLGRSVSKEQYAYIFDRQTIMIDRDKSYTMSDPQDLMHREPLVAQFAVRGPDPTEAFTFKLINVHTDPDEVRQEVVVMQNVMQLVREDGFNEDDAILLGDFNADNALLGELGRNQGITTVINGMPTNVRGTEQYDNIIFAKYATTEFTGRGGVVDFMRQYNLSMDQAIEVSDHLPVWAEFSIYEGGQPGRVATTPTLPRR